MQITYDPEADALYIALREGAAVDSHDVSAGMTVDLDGDGQILGIEILDAKARMGNPDDMVVTWRTLTRPLAPTPQRR